MQKSLNNNIQPNPLPTVAFASPGEWATWLHAHHDTDGIWIQMAKKTTGIPSITHEQALDVALCYGWIDGLRHALDERYFLQKFTPRRPRSNWSERNIAKAKALIAEGKMQPGGLAEIEAAKTSGRWRDD